MLNDRVAQDLRSLFVSYLYLQHVQSISSSCNRQQATDSLQASEDRENKNVPYYYYKITQYLEISLFFVSFVFSTPVFTSI
jgi:hypothetical protein